MIKKRIITLASTGLLLSSTVLSSAALAAGGLERNQAALGVAGRTVAAGPTCAAPAGSPFLIRNQCAVDTDASQLRGGRGGAGGFIVALLAAAAVIAGIIIVLDNDSSPDGGFNPPEPTPSPTPTPTPTPVSS